MISRPVARSKQISTPRGAAPETVSPCGALSTVRPYCVYLNSERHTIAPRSPNSQLASLPCARFRTAHAGERLSMEYSISDGCGYFGATVIRVKLALYGDGYDFRGQQKPGIWKFPVCIVACAPSRSRVSDAPIRPGPSLLRRRGVTRPFYALLQSSHTH